jgi:hypothetical protein
MSFPDPIFRKRKRNETPNLKAIDIPMKLIFKFIHPYLTNWKTTLTGIGMVLSGTATIVHEVTTLASGGTPDIEIISMAAGTVVGGVGLITARDANKSTEQSK